MPNIKIVFLWHMHQPFYKDLVSEEYRLPWVRMHALKDYYGMVKLLDEFPRIHQTFNLVPSLIAQIEDYVSGSANDPFFDIAAKPARDLTADERRFALTYLFQANPVHMIGRYSRYQELWEQFQALGLSPERGARLFTAQDFTDLQVLSQLAWFDEFVLEDNDVAALVNKARYYSEQDQKFVISKQREVMAAVLPAYKKAAESGSVEISTSPFYHPILPLLYDTDLGAVSNPGVQLPVQHFRHPEDAREQLLRGLDLHERVFGVRPRGVWPSEGSVSEQVLSIAQELGVGWMATDEGVLGRSIGYNFHRDGAGNLSSEGASRLYRVYRYEKGPTQMHMVFRDHTLSDLIGFVYSGMDAKSAATDFVRRIRQSAELVLKTGRDAIVPIILDGENAWEFYPGSGREFLRRVYDAIQSDPAMEAVTAAEAIDFERTKKTGVNIGRLSSIVPGSWINANFNVWIGSHEDNRSWDYLSAARELYAQAASSAEEPARALAYEELLIAEGSDWNWWYGPEHHTANDRDFDELYRKHLSNVYQALGSTPPDYLAQPIAAPISRPSFIPQTAYIRPRITAEFARYFDWIGAAMYTADRRSGAMHGKQFLLDCVYAGVDEFNIYGRLDFTGEVPEWKFDIGVQCETWTPVSDVTSVIPDSGDGSPAPFKEKSSLRLEVAVENRVVTGWKTREPETDPTPLKGRVPSDRTIAGSAQRRQRGVEVGLRKNFSFKIPFTLLGAVTGSKIRLRFSVWRNGLPVDALPVEGWVELSVASEEELEQETYRSGPLS